MNAGGSTMIQSNMLTSAKGAPPDEVAFTERNDRVDPPRYFKGVINNVGMIGEMVHDGIIRVDVMDAVPGNRPFSNIFPNKQVAESTFIATDSVVWFDLTFSTGLFMVSSDFNVAFPVKFVDGNGEKNSHWQLNTCKYFFRSSYRIHRWP